MKRARSKSSASRNPAGRPKDAAKRADILRAAEALFMQLGYERTSMLAVAKKAGVSKLTIYSHFADKDALFKDVVTQKCNRTIMPDAYAALASKPVKESLVRIARNFAGLMFSHDAMCLHRVVQAEVGRHPHVVKLFYEAGPLRVRGHFAALLDAWKKQGKIKVADTALAASHFFSLLKGELHMRSMLRVTPPPSPAEIEKHIQASLHVFLSAYRNKT